MRAHKLMAIFMHHHVRGRDFALRPVTIEEKSKGSIVDLWVKRTMYPSTYRCQNDHWRKISPSKNYSVHFVSNLSLRATFGLKR